MRGYKEKGNINTPLELAIENEIDRFSLAIDAIDRVPKLQKIGSHAKEKLVPAVSKNGLRLGKSLGVVSDFGLLIFRVGTVIRSKVILRKLAPVKITAD